MQHLKYKISHDYENGKYEPISCFKQAKLNFSTQYFTADEHVLDLQKLLTNYK